jgi:hypothetical protein
MYYREFGYNENQIHFNSDGTYTWMYSGGTDTGGYFVELVQVFRPMLCVSSTRIVRNVQPHCA